MTVIEIYQHDILHNDEMSSQYPEEKEDEAFRVEEAGMRRVERPSS